MAANTEQMQQQSVDRDEETHRDSSGSPVTPQHITTIITSSRQDEAAVQEDDANIVNSTSSSSSSSSRGNHHRDSTWLELEVCREFLRGDCSRSAEECRYAHPNDASVIVKDGKVTCCFDYLKDRCTREACKYLHPPSAIKDRLIMAGKHYGQQMSVTTKPPPPPLSPTIPLSGVSPYPVFMDTSPTGHYSDVSQMFTFPSQQMTYRVQVCENFDNNITCPSGHNCFFAHPEPYVRRDSSNAVSCCWNYLRGYCRHNQCWFYHPPPNITYAILHGTVPPPQVFMEPFLMTTYGGDKSPYSSPTSSLGQYSYSIPPYIMNQQYSPSNMTFPPNAVTAISTLPQAIVQ